MTSPTPPLLIERQGPRATLTINRPDQRNALSTAVLARLREALAEVKADPAIRVVVLAGAGDRAFCAGGDLRQMGETASDPYAQHLGRTNLAGLFRDLWELGKPTIARVQGYALAGGFGLATACDFIVASERAEFGAPEATFGLWPYMISVPLMTAMPPKIALRYILTGERISAERGRELGFVTELVPHEELDAALDGFVGKLLAASPQAVALGRTSFYAVLNHDIEARLRMLEALLTVSLGMPDAAEGLSAMAARRAPSWQKNDG